MIGDPLSQPLPSHRPIVIERITVRRFGPIRSLDLSLRPGINVVTGPNASGKTQLMGAILFGLFGIHHSGAILDRLAEEPTMVEVALGDGSVQQRLVSEVIPYRHAITRLNCSHRCIPELNDQRAPVNVVAESSGELVLRQGQNSRSDVLEEAMRLLAVLDPLGRWNEIFTYRAPSEYATITFHSVGEDWSLRLACTNIASSKLTQTIPLLIDEPLFSVIGKSAMGVVIELLRRIALVRQVILFDHVVPPEMSDHVVAQLTVADGSIRAAASFSGRIPTALKRPREKRSEVQHMASDLHTSAVPLVFISHALADERSVEQLTEQFSVLKRQGAVDTWHKRCIGIGRDPELEVQAAIDRAVVAIVVVTAAYFNDDAIQMKEVPYLLERRRKGDIRIVALLVKPCDWQAAEWLSDVYVYPADRQFIMQGNGPAQDTHFASIVSEVRKLIAGPASPLPLAPTVSDNAGHPTPRYPDERTRGLSQQLEEARARKSKLEAGGFATDRVDAEILNLRRQMRDGGQLRAGDSLGNGRYLLLDEAGRGGFSVVWKAHDHNGGNIVAIKVLHSVIAGDPMRRERFFRGARAMARLDHEGFVGIYDAESEDGGYYYFVMEFVEGRTLHQAITQKCLLSDDDIFRLILQVGAALSFAHGKGLVHRDIKPANILLDQDNTPRLTDFDLVHAADTTGGTRTSAMGTFLYAAPELLDHPQDADARADVYGLGMTTLFCLLKGELPRSAFRHPEKFVEKTNTNPMVKAVLKRALDWEVERRFPDAASFCEALRRAIDNIGDSMSMAEDIREYATNPAISMATVVLRFYVSPDETHVRIEVVDGENVLRFSERAGFYALLLLARARLKDAADGRMRIDEHGWYDLADLTHHLGTDERHINLTTYRLREAFVKAGIEDGKGIIERRPRQIRIGTGRLQEIKG